MRNEYKEKITSTADWQINRLKIPGYSSEDIENALKDTLNASYLEMFELYDKVIDWEYVRNKDIYEQINAEYIPSEAKHEIEAAINNLKKEYDIRLDLIEVAKMEVGDIFGAAPYLDDRGKLRFALVINEDIDYNVVKKKIQRRYDKGRFAGKSIEDYIAHEMAHIMTYQDCKNEAEFRTRQRIVERQFMQGISQYADKTGKGEESLAEAFVRYRNKEKIPIRAELLIRSYIERWKK